MNEIDKKALNFITSSHKRGPNRYPGLELEKSLNLDKLFSEKAASKKQHLILMAQARLRANKH